MSDQSASVLEEQTSDLEFKSRSPSDHPTTSSGASLPRSPAASRPDFWSNRYELAIATGKISREIAGPYQDALTWARHLGSAETFIDRINRPGSSSQGMRSFVQTFRTRLQPGREIEGPMVVVIVGGLLTSRALNLLVLPTLAMRYGRSS